MHARLTKYEILGALASGGMADVWLARVSGPRGFDKLVVVKTIRPNLAGEKGFVEMFFNEARVAAMLNHPNCVQIFDVGEEGGVSYIAMEFIDGFALSRALKRSEGLKTPLPIAVVGRIMIDAANGLDHAHSLVDRQGNPLKLVHRDISPDNVLVSFGGQSKVVDFGIAKAASVGKAEGETTRTGTLKGKFGYMAPEYLMGMPIDGRADLFALGVVMYRSLTGKKPFVGATEALVCNAVLHDEPAPPSKLNPGISPALDEVVLKALKKDPDQRFENARAMRKALEQALDKPADADDVAAVMDQLWPTADAERAAVRALAAGQSKSAEQPVLNELASGSVEVVFTKQSSLSKVVTPSPPPPRRRVAFGAIAALLAASVAGWLVVRPDSVVELPRVAPVAVLPTPDAAIAVAAIEAPPVAAPTVGKVEFTSVVPADIFLNEALVGRAPGTFELPVGKQTLKVTSRELGLTRTMSVVVKGDEVVKVKTPIGKGSIEVRVSPWANVKLDGRSVGTTPLPLLDVLEGRHVLELSNPKAGKSKKVVVQVAAGEKKLVRETF